MAHFDGKISLPGVVSFWRQSGLKIILICCFRKVSSLSLKSGRRNARVLSSLTGSNVLLFLAFSSFSGNFDAKSDVLNVTAAWGRGTAFTPRKMIFCERMFRKCSIMSEKLTIFGQLLIFLIVNFLIYWTRHVVCFQQPCSNDFYSRNVEVYS